MADISFDQIRAQYPIADIVGQAIKLQKSGREFKGCCPFHAEKTPSFHVVPEKEFAHCFGCGWHGDVVDFVRDFQRCSDAEAIDMLTGSTGLSEQSDEDKAERARILEERERQQREARADAIKEAAEIWASAGEADPHHPYLTRKQVPAHTCRQTPQGLLLLPIRDCDGQLQSVQTIADDGAKKFHPGAPVGGGSMNIGINMGREILCEGYATGATIYEAIVDQVRVTFSCGNMEKVARHLHGKGRSIVLAADTGMASEKMAALGAELGVPVVYPRGDIPDDGTDFNDQALAFGIEDVAATFTEALREFSRSQDIREKATQEDTGPLDLWAAPPVPALPRGLLPPLIEQFAFESANQMGTDPAGFAIAGLAACAAMIPDGVKAKPKQHEDWTESARIWTMLIGSPSTRKSPMIGKTVSRIKKLDAALLAENNRNLIDWQENKTGDRPPAPRLRIEDATTESAQEVCRESPNGVLVLQDELSGLFGRMEKYGGKGGAADRSFWLQAYNGGQYAVNRIGRGSFLIDNLSVSMIGGIQPEAIRSIMEHATDDGLIQRFIPLVLQPAERDRDVPAPPVAERFGDMLEALKDIAPPSNFFGVKPITFSDGAREIREELADKHFQFVTALEGFNPKLSSHIGKYDGLFVRLCLIWHCAEAVTDGQELSTEISTKTARRVADFLHGFILEHAKSFYMGVVGMTAYDPIVQAVGSYILSHQVTDITARDMTRNVRLFRSADVTAREAVTDILESFGWLERADKRRNAASWKVPPEVHETYRQKAEFERVKKAHFKEVIEEAVKERGEKA